MTKAELSLLLFFEARAVDFGGRVNTQRMNEADFKIAKLWVAKQYIKFGRICARDAATSTHWVILSAPAWEEAQAERRARAARMWTARTWQSTEEAKASEG